MHKVLTLFISQILLVPTTEFLLNSRDRDTNAAYADLAGSEDFLASHVLRVPGGIGPSTRGKDGAFRDNRGKAKQYTTANGRTVIIKDTFVYSNKGKSPAKVFRPLSHTHARRFQELESSAAGERCYLLS